MSIRRTGALAAMAGAAFGLSVGIAPAAAQDLGDAAPSIVRVQAAVPGDAATADSLGTAREGNGIVIDSSGLILTIGYLVVEADRIQVQTVTGTYPASFVGYDPDTGFGLVRAGSARGLKPMPLGESSALAVGDQLLVRGFDGDTQEVRVVSRGEFVGSWEYLLDSAVYTAPPFHDYGGTPLIRDGRLVGVGSVFTIFDVPGAGRLPANMFVPIDLLKPILDAMVRSGGSGRPAHPWLGVSTSETQTRVVVESVTPGGPAADAGLKPGDIILAVGGRRVAGVGEFYRRLWSTGAAGVTVRLRVLQDDSIRDLTVKSVDRSATLKLHPGLPGAVPSGPAVWLRP